MEKKVKILKIPLFELFQEKEASIKIPHPDLLVGFSSHSLINKLRKFQKDPSYRNSFTGIQSQKAQAFQQKFASISLLSDYIYTINYGFMDNRYVFRDKPKDRVEEDEFQPVPALNVDKKSIFAGYANPSALNCNPQVFRLPLYYNNTSNLNQQVVEKIRMHSGNQKDTAIFYYCYALLQRSRDNSDAGNELSFIDEPFLFDEIARLGLKFYNIHTLKQQFDLGANFLVLDNNQVSQPYFDGQGKLFINQFQFFNDVDADVWQFAVMNQPVLSNWLVAREGKKLSTEDLILLQRILLAIQTHFLLQQDLEQILQELF